jgi:phosphatidylglycerophosphate synthase
MAIARGEHRRLRSSALMLILAFALAMLLVAVGAAGWLQLSAWYVAKSTVIFMMGAALLLRGLPQHPFTTLGPGNAVTLARAALVAPLAALVGESTPALAVATAAVTIVAIAVCVLDGLDGRLARRTGMTSRFGARFDMETDAVLVAVLAVLAWQLGKVGAWALWIGALRYVYLLAGLFLPGLRRPLPPSTLRKTIAVAQVIALTIILLPFVSPAMSAPIAATALTALLLSFLQQIVLVYRC